MPIETDNIRFALTQEFIHAVQIDIDHLHNGFNAPLGETILTVGLAMRGTEHLLPGHTSSLYTWRPNEWLRQCLRRSRIILKGIQPYLARSDSDNTTRFTYGTGMTGLKSEAYCAAGWVLVGNLLHDGYTYADLARLPEADMARFADSKIAEMLARH